MTAENSVYASARQQIPGREAGMETVKTQGRPRAAAAVCPDCGDAMARHARDMRRLVCERCRNEQYIEVLGPGAAIRQRSALHNAGADRLLRSLDQG